MFTNDTLALTCWIWNDVYLLSMLEDIFSRSRIHSKCNMFPSFGIHSSLNKQGIKLPLPLNNFFVKIIFVLLTWLWYTKYKLLSSCFMHYKLCIYSNVNLVHLEIILATIFIFSILSSLFLYFYFWDTS